MMKSKVELWMFNSILQFDVHRSHPSRIPPNNKGLLSNNILAPDRTVKLEKRMKFASPGSNVFHKSTIKRLVEENPRAYRKKTIYPRKV